MVCTTRDVEEALERSVRRGVRRAALQDAFLGQLFFLQLLNGLEIEDAARICASSTIGTLGLKGASPNSHG